MAKDFQLFLLPESDAFKEDKILDYVERWILSLPKSATVIIDTNKPVQLAQESRCQVLTSLTNLEQWEGEIDFAFVLSSNEKWVQSIPPCLSQTVHIKPCDYFLLTSQEAAALLGLPYSTMRKYLREGRFPEAQPPQGWVIPLSDVYNFVQPDGKPGRPATISG